MTVTTAQQDEIVAAAWRAVVALHDADAFAVLDAAYREPQRAYHGRNHIASLLAQLQRFESVCARPDLVTTAIFWHDSVYLTRTKLGLVRADAKNVEESVQLFSRHTRLPTHEIDAVAELIGATSSHMTARASAERYPGFGADLDLFLDLDLSPLAASEEEFEVNERGVRFEYAFVPEPLFNHARGEILKSMLTRGPALYRREETRAAFAERALANLTKRVAELLG